MRVRHRPFLKRLQPATIAAAVVVAAAAGVLASAPASAKTPTCRSQARELFPVAAPLPRSAPAAQRRQRTALRQTQAAARQAYLRGCRAGRDAQANSPADDDAATLITLGGIAIVALIGLPLLFDLIAAYVARGRLANRAKDGLDNPELGELVRAPLGGMQGLARALLAVGVLAILALALFYLLAKRPFANSADIADHLITIFGTLATAITAFYFGSRTAEQSAATGARTAGDIAAAGVGAHTAATRDIATAASESAAAARETAAAARDTVAVAQAQTAAGERAQAEAAEQQQRAAETQERAAEVQREAAAEQARAADEQASAAEETVELDAAPEGSDEDTPEDTAAPPQA